MHARTMAAARPASASPNFPPPGAPRPMSSDDFARRPGSGDLGAWSTADGKPDDSLAEGWKAVRLHVVSCCLGHVTVFEMAGTLGQVPSASRAGEWSYVQTATGRRQASLSALFFFSSASCEDPLQRVNLVMNSGPCSTRLWLQKNHPGPRQLPGTEAGSSGRMHDEMVGECGPRPAAMLR